MESSDRIKELEYEVSVLKGKLDEKQAVDIGVTATFTFDATQVTTAGEVISRMAEDFCKAISFWGFHRGNWQNFIKPDELAEWTKALELFLAQEHDRDVLEGLNLLYWKYKELNHQSVDKEFVEAYNILCEELQAEVGKGRNNE